MVKDKENLKSCKRKAATYKKAPIRLSVDFSMKTLQARRAWQEIFKVMKSKTTRKITQQSCHVESKGHVKNFP